MCGGDVGERAVIAGIERIDRGDVAAGQHRWRWLGIERQTAHARSCRRACPTSRHYLLWHFLSSSAPGLGGHICDGSPSRRPAVEGLMLWPHKIFLCGIVATWHSWPAYACWRRIVGLRRANHGRRLEAEDACGCLEAFTPAGATKFSDDPHGGVGISHGAQRSHARTVRVRNLCGDRQDG